MPLFLLLAFTPIATRFASAQATSINGSIQGSVQDPGGAAVPGATVTVTGTDTNVSKTLKTDAAGFYSSGPLIPGRYTISVTAPGFGTTTDTLSAQIGTVTNGNLKLSVGGSQQTVTVTGTEIEVNSDQSSVESVITPEQIRNLPVQGRNFLDLAQLEPGVQLQSGETFDPTKAGYSALSIGGVSGRTTRILLDGSDVTDETVGTTIFNVPSGAISEFQLNRSTGDVSGDITSSGSVFVSTPSGTNKYHGQLFYQFQDHNVGFANAPGGYDAPFQRNQFGGNVGGPILKDKLFFFGDLERIKQDSAGVVTLSNTFAALNQQFPTYASPFRDTYSALRLDYNGAHGIHYFARANYEVNSVASTFGYGYSLYANRDNTPGLAYGADFTTGNFTHSLRGSYEKFHNLIGDLTASNAGLYNPLPGVELHVPGSGLYTGPNLLAPQQTYQSDKQFRYDGSWTHSSHIVRYGVNLNRILGGGFASFFGLAPEVATGRSPLPGGDPANPLDYSAASVTIGNGQGYNTEIPSFGAPAGGQGDWRLGLYIADTWKVTPNFTLNAGLRYQRDTGRSDSDLAPLPCSTINPNAVPVVPCTDNDLILDQFGPGLGDRVRQPNNALGPQLGFAYAPAALNGKTVLRSGIGIFFENFVFNNVLFDRPFKLQKGLFFQETAICGGTNALSLPDGTSVDNYNGTPIATLCSEPVSQSAAAFTALQQQYQQVTTKVGAQSNGGYVGNTLAINNGFDAYAPHQFTTPRSLHVNFGIQQQLFKGGVLSVDFLHQIDWRFEEAVDVNRVGSAAYFDPVAAKTAITNTLAACGVTTVDQAIAACPGIYGIGGGGATIADFASNGLDSGAALNSGYPNPGVIAFPGKNPLVGQGFFQFPSGKSAYDALQVQFRGRKANPAKGIADSNLEVSYNYSRFVTNVGGASGATSSDQYFAPGVWDFNNPTRYIGRGSLDRPQQFSIGGFFTITHGPQIGLIGHYLSAPPTSLTLDNTSGNTAQIFQTDVTGDGQTGDLLPETDPGTYMRNYHGGSLNRIINYYNSRYAGQLTPAGQTVVASGLLTPAQMVALGAVQQQIAEAPAKALENGALRGIDVNFSYPIKMPFISETFSLEPTVAFYNVANFSNFTSPDGTLSNLADVQSGSLNGPSSQADRNQFRTGRGSGTFNVGGPRSMEFQLKLNF